MKDVSAFPRHPSFTRIRCLILVLALGVASFVLSELPADAQRQAVATLPDTLVLRPGVSGILPLVLSTTSRLSHVTFNLRLSPGPGLTATVRAVTAVVCSNLLENVADTRLRLELEACSPFLIASREAASLWLTAPSNATSGFFELALEPSSALATNGEPVTIVGPTNARPCRVVVLGAEPLLAPRPVTGEVSTVTVYAAPGGSYRLEKSPDLHQWNGFVTGLATGIHQHADGHLTELPARFYRAVRSDQTNVVTGDHLVTTNGEVVIHPVNHASLVLSWNGLMIYVDPVGSSALYAPFRRADLVLVTHVHSDHFSASTLAGVTNAGAVILAPQAVANSLSGGLRTMTTVLANGASATVFDVRVEAIPAYNSNHPIGTGNGYVVTVGGRRLFFSGDTGDIPDIRALTGIDVAFLCINVPFTMTVPEAAAVTRAFRPRVVYPYHYRNGDGSLSDLGAFRQQVGTDLGIEVRLRAWY